MWHEQAATEWARRVISTAACCHSVKLCELEDWALWSQQCTWAVASRNCTFLPLDHGAFCFVEIYRPTWIKGTAEYARPVGKTAERALKAKNHVRREMEELCYVIRSMGEKSRDGRFHVSFGDLFQRWA